jgi:hypothetical protein
MLSLELVDQDNLASEILSTLSNHRPDEETDVLARYSRGRWNLDSVGKWNAWLCTFYEAVQNQYALVSIVCDVSSKPCLHHGLLAAIPCVAPEIRPRTNINVELGLALQSVADAFGYWVED